MFGYSHVYDRKSGLLAWQAKGSKIDEYVLYITLCNQFSLYIDDIMHYMNKHPAITASLDIAHQKEVESKTDAAFQTIFQQSPISTQIFSPDGMTIMVNKAWENLWQTKQEDIVDKYNILRDKQMEEKKILAYIKKAFRGEKVFIPAIKYESEKTIPGVTAASCIWISGIMYPIKDERGKISKIVLQHEDITKQQQLELVLKEAEEKYKELAEISVDGIFLTDKTGNITYVNPSLEKMFNIPASVSIGTHFSKYLTKKSALRSAIYFMKLTKGEGVKGVEFECVTHDKKKFPIEASASPIMRDGKFEGLLCNVRNITERRRAEENLLSEKEFSESSINSLPGVFYLFDKNGKFLRWNHNLEKVSGYSPREITAMHPLDFFNSDEKRIVETAIKRVFAKGNDSVEANLVGKSGRRIPYYFIGRRMLIDKEPYLIGSGVDISGLIQVEKNLRFLSEASKILSSSLEYTKTLKNVAKLAVPEIADWCGVSMETDKGIEQLAVAHIDPKKVKWAKELNRKNPPDPNAKTGIPNILRTGQSEFYPDIPDEMLVKAAKNEQQLTLLRKLRFTSVMVVPMRIDKEVIGAISFVSAESGRHYTKSDLAIAESLGARAGIAIQNARLYTDAQKAISLRNDFISLASHELKTPITSLKIYSQSLSRQFEKKGDSKFKAYFKKMDQQTDKLSLLVNDLLNISKIQQGKLDFTMGIVDLNIVVKDTVEVIQETTKRHTIRIEGKIDKTVYADQYKIYQVLTNLLTNAIKYSPNADKVIVRLVPEKDFAVVTVQDFGLGIKEAYQKKIFEQYYRVENADEKTFPGLGMGLYISLEIVKRHGGIMNVVSAKGKGSQFSFTLPYAALQEK